MQAPETTTAQQEAAEALRTHQAALVATVTTRQFARNPEWEVRYGAVGRAKCEQDNGYHLEYLAEALDFGTLVLFEEYLVWAAEMLAARAITPSHLIANLDALDDAAADVLSGEALRALRRVTAAGRRRLTTLKQGEAPSFIDSESAFPEQAQAYLKALLNTDRHGANRVVVDAVQAGLSVRDAYLHIFQPTQREIGRLWQLNRVSVGQEHFCTAVTQQVMAGLYPHIFSAPRIGRRLVAACVSGELHEIGARMVADFFEMDGWDTVFLGASTPAPDVVKMVVMQCAEVLCLSATITRHVKHVAALIEAVRADAQARSVRVMVGGYPFNLEPDLGLRIGADGYAASAAGALEEAARLC